ncbi:MAG: 2OG-Fe(II) oxygenase [bacterium]|nr:2OG-Fe(II) oxygenase [bacterium]
MNKLYADLQHRFDAAGFLILKGSEFYSDAQWEIIDGYSNQVSYESVQKGLQKDSEYAAHVGRIVLDGPTPSGEYLQINEPENLADCSTELLWTILNPRVLAVTSAIASIDIPKVQRCQYNLLRSGDHIGKHIDALHGIPYDLTFVLGLEGDYQGGIFQLYGQTNSEVFFHKISEKDLIIFKSPLLHSVTKVSSGKRKTLCLFLKK